MALIKNVGSSEGKETFANVIRWFTVVVGLLTVVLGLHHVCRKGVSLSVDGEPIADINRMRWRLPLFTFVPDLFADYWTPLVFGLLTVMWNFETFSLTVFCKNFQRLFVWLLVMGLFANLGYDGGLGILFGSLTLFDCLLSLIAFLIYDGPAHLRITKDFKLAPP